MLESKEEAKPEELILPLIIRGNLYLSTKNLCYVIANGIETVYQSIDWIHHHLSNDPKLLTWKTWQDNSSPKDILYANENNWEEILKVLAPEQFCSIKFDKEIALIVMFPVLKSQTPEVIQKLLPY